MDTIERQREILSLLSARKAVTVRQLCGKLYVSPATARRDLAALERQGLLRRTHGGAALPEGSGDELSDTLRSGEHTREKAAIGRLASFFIKDSGTVFMDSSSTVCAVVPFLARHKRLTVVTNGLHCALALSAQSDCTVYLPAGRLLTRSNSVVDADTLESLARFHADVALISCAGFSPAAGVTERSVEQARVKAQMLARAKVKILLCDSSKLDHVFLSRTCGAEELDYIITDKPPAGETAEYLASLPGDLVFPE